MTYTQNTDEMMRQAMALYNGRQFKDAKELFQQICSIDKTNGQCWMMLGAVNGELGDTNKALFCFNQAVKLQPNNAQALYGLGNILRLQGKSKKALLKLGRAAQINPEFAAAWNMQGTINRSLGKLEIAVVQFQHALKLRPDWTEAHLNLANTQSELGRVQDAISTYINLGQKLFDLGRPKETISIYRKALVIAPDNPVLHSNLGHIYQSVGELDEAENCLNKALSLNPDSAGAYNNMGNVLKSQGRVDEADACFRRALQIDPADHGIRSNLLFCLQSVSKYSRTEILGEHIQWAKFHAPSGNTGKTYSHTPNPNRKLRIGYVSPDLRTHAVGYLVEPIFANHNPDQFDVICYAEVSAPDKFTQHLQSMSHGWRNTYGLSDPQVVNAIQTDKIDILVDLAGHTNKNRLTVFAEKPAPIQISYLGYSDTTGMSAIDYRLTDEFTDPAGDEVFYTEKLYYLKNSFSCYAPPAGIREVSKLPARSAGGITFGCLNNLYKINPSVIDVWCRVLNAIPSSRLILFRHVLKGKAKDRLYDEFIKRGVDSSRVDLQCELPPEYYQSYPHGLWHLGLFEKIDILLDTFPRDSHVIACEALWMGVPTITLYGKRHSGRICASVLKAAGLSQFIASTPDEYVNIAKAFAGSLDKLEHMRSGMRERMKNSPLCDGVKFTKNLEEAYRDVWKKWCAHTDTQT